MAPRGWELIQAMRLTLGFSPDRTTAITRDDLLEEQPGVTSVKADRRRGIRLDRQHLVETADPKHLSNHRIHAGKDKRLVG